MGSSICSSESSRAAVPKKSGFGWERGRLARLLHRRRRDCGRAARAPRGDAAIRWEPRSQASSWHPWRPGGCLLAVLICLGWTRAASACVGDCNGDGMVTINELVLGVNVALGAAQTSACPAFDSNLDHEVRINELLGGVNNGATGCPIETTPTPTATLPPTATPTPTGGAGETRCAVPPGEGVNFDPTQPFCDLLSSYRFFRGDGSTQEPNDGVLPYDLNTQLFADYALKHRFVWLPAGASATYSARESFDFPVGTVIIKTFAFPVDYRDLSLGERLIETRLLVRRASGWDPITYTWQSEGCRRSEVCPPGEACRCIIGKGVPVTWTQADGTPRSIDYKVPNTNQCKECHEEHNEVIGPLGPKARNLNKDYVYTDGSANQLTRWTALGYLQGAPSPDEAPRAAVFDDPDSGTIEARARTYMDVNCAHCHNPSGLARTSGLYLNIEEMNPSRLGVCKAPVAAGQGSGDLEVDIYPGAPELSILSYRMESTEAGVAMPELGRQTAHTEALDVVNAWIESLPGTCP